jgi:predicted lipoprotein with Yx(FWY)xxD motif
MKNMRTLVIAATALVIGAAAPAFGAGPGGASPTAAHAAPTLTVRGSAYGRVLFDARGKALYAFTRDPKGGKSRCYGACAAAWPPFYAKGSLRAGKGVRPRFLGTTVRRDGKRQVTYAGRPLYYYVGDRSPGEIRCQNVTEFGGTWLVVRASGHPVR